MAAVLALAVGCASSDRFADSASAGSQHAAVDPANVRTVAIESFANEADCTRRAPTGSRIAVERCEIRDAAAGALDAAAHNQAREDLDEMRRRQVYQEQARQQALTRRF